MGRRVRGLPGGGRRVHERGNHQQRERARGRPGTGGAGFAPCGSRGDAHGIYCSNEVHYSVTRAVELLGIGSDNLRAIPLDGLRRMQPDALARAIDQDLAAGVTPIAVVATAGTTLTGAIDPIDAIADVCEPRGVWLHVDGAYGLPAASTPSREADFDGLARADSCSIDGHKWLYLPKACGLVLVRDAEALAARSRMSRATCRISSTSCMRPTSRWSTRGRSAR